MILTNPGPAVTREQLAGFEKQIGGQLPDEYKTFLLASNGGFPRPPVGFYWKGELNLIYCFEMLLPGNDEIGLAAGLASLQRAGVEGRLPIATIDVQDKDVCIDFLDSPGQITLASYRYENEAGVAAELSVVADSFSEFMGRLVESPAVLCRIAHLGEHGTPGDLEEYLLEGKDIDALGSNHLPVIREAIRFRNMPLVNACIAKGANLANTVHQAVKVKDVDLVKVLVAAGADVNQVDECGDRPLSYVTGIALPGEEGARNRRLKQVLIELGAIV